MSSAAGGGDAGAASRPAGRPRSERRGIWLLLAALIVPFLSAIARIRIGDAQKVPASGAFVLAPNHHSEIDPLIMGVTMWRVGRMPRFLAKASLFRVPVLGALLRASGQVPVERTGATASSDPLAAARHIVDNGLCVIIYPEGTLTRDPDFWPMRGKYGAVRTALQADIPLIPVAHWGAQRVLPRYGKLSLFPRKPVTVVFGDPVDLSEFRGRASDPAALAAATARVMDAITRLLEGLRGEQAPAERWDPAAHGQTETGRL